MIKVLVADSSPVDVDTLIAILTTDPEIEVIGVATTGKQAIELVSKLRPDIVTISDSLERVDSEAYAIAIKQIMAYSPTPILILTDSYSESKKDSVFKATSMGALDVIEKPTGHAWESAPAPPGLTRGNRGRETAPTGFVETVKSLSKVKVVTHLAGKLERRKRYSILDGPVDSHKSTANRTLTPAYEGARDSRLETRDLGKIPQTPGRMVAIAASTGGPSALAEVLRGLPAELGIGIVIVQHVAEGFSAGLAEWLDREAQITVRQAQDGDGIKFGYAFLAPTGFHMVVKACAGENRIMLNRTPSVSGHRPSADVLFASVAETYGSSSIGVILTGMGSDGARGIVAIKNAGGRTIVQAEESCVVFGMPKAAIETGVVDEILPLGSIAERLVQLCRER